MNDIPEDWVLLEAANRCDWPFAEDTNDGGIGELRDDYGRGRGAEYLAFRALCDMIARYETKPVDPDEEAVKRIFTLVLGSHKSERIWEESPSLLLAAVSQYKQEKGNG